MTEATEKKADYLKGLKDEKADRLAQIPSESMCTKT